MRKVAMIILWVGTVTLQAQNLPEVLSAREQARLIDEMLKERVEQVLPALMDRTGIDMWIIIAREYNEDPVIRTMLPATWLNARRRTILVIFNPGNGKPLETLAVARYDVGEIFKKAWDKEKQPDQWQRLADIVVERNPARIGVNRSELFALADGLSSTEYEGFMKKLPQKYHHRVTSAEKLAVGWLETRTEREMQIYATLCRIAHQIIAEAFSEKVVQPGITTTEDVVWWLRERVAGLKLDTWFHPSVSIQRSDRKQFDHIEAFSKGDESQVIMQGDLLHVDFGITYLRLNTDTQQHAYVLKSGETDAPAFLKKALSDANRLQDIFTGNFATGSTGNQVLKSSLDQAKAANLNPTIYTHPLGFHGHAAGPTIGLWDQQESVPGNGDYPIYKNTAYSIELNNAIYLEEWNKEIRIMLEEDAFFDGQKVTYIDGRQTELFLIPRQNQTKSILDN